MKIILIIFLSVALSGCTWFTRTEYQEYPVPVYTVPAPPSIDRPELPIHELTEEDRKDTDKVIRAYIVSIRLLLNYAVAKEKIIQKYDELSKQTEFVDTRVRRFGVTADTQEERRLKASEAQELSIRSMRVSETAHGEFSNIINEYNRNKERILREFNNEDN